MNKRVTMSELLAVDLPEQTRTYKPLGHGEIDTAIRQYITDEGLSIASSRFKASKKGEVAIGEYVIDNEDSGIQTVIGWLNSYDRSKRFGVGGGAQVAICENGMFIAPFRQMKKHVGTIQEDYESMIKEIILESTKELSRYVRAKNNFEHTPVSKDALHKLLGEMYFQEKIISSTQMNIIRKELEFSEHFAMVSPESSTVWNLYNVLTESLKTVHPSNYVDTHVQVFEKMKDYTIAYHAAQ